MNRVRGFYLTRSQVERLFSPELRAKLHISDFDNLYFTAPVEVQEIIGALEMRIESSSYLSDEHAEFIIDFIDWETTHDCAELKE